MAGVDDSEVCMHFSLIKYAIYPRLIPLLPLVRIFRVLFFCASIFFSYFNRYLYTRKRKNPFVELSHGLFYILCDNIVQCPIQAGTSITRLRMDNLHLRPRLSRPRIQLNYCMIALTDGIRPLYCGKDSDNNIFICLI